MKNKITEIVQLNMSLEEISKALNIPVGKLQRLKINTIVDILNAYWTMKDSERHYQMLVGNLF